MHLHRGIFICWLSNSTHLSIPISCCTALSSRWPFVLCSTLNLPPLCSLFISARIQTGSATPNGFLPSFRQVALRVLSHIEVQDTRRPLGSGEVGVAFFSGLKYCMLTALATGGDAVVIGPTRGSAVASEFDLTRRGGVE